MAFTLNPVPPPPDKLLPSLSRSKPTTMPSSYKAVKRDRHSPPPIASGSKSAGSPLNRVASTDSRRFHMSFVAFPKNCNAACARVFTERRFLALLIEYTLWDDLYALASTCRQFRHIMREPELKDVILSRFIPGYQYGLQNRDPQRFQDVEASIRELHLLMLSQRVPLHKYPMHAYSLLTRTTFETEDYEDMTKKLVAFSLAHSRFVLLLQALVHSSPFPSNLEPEEARLGSKFSQPALRELVFPAPLSYISTSEYSGAATAADSRSIDPSNLTYNPSPRMTLPKIKIPFMGTPSPPPPPPSESALKLYSGSWRRPSYRVSSSASEDDFAKPLQRPHRRFASADLSSDSSVGVSPSPPSRNSITGRRPSFVRVASPHDLDMATSRVRAPILRVFVPCSVLSEVSIQECEDQLMEVGLWRHLSTGDIVYNLGYVPPTPDESSSSDDDLAEQSRYAWRKWLIFNGYCLVPFFPPAPPPLEDSLALPSPFYYAHILPAFTSPIYFLKLPPYDDIPDLMLVHASTRVRSPPSPNGFATVKKYVWTATLWRQEMDGMGEGWYGEWVLEADGTREGREAIIECLKGDDTGLWECEVVRERSSTGRLWLRLVSSYLISDSMEDESSSLSLSDRQ